MEGGTEPDVDQYLDDLLSSGKDIKQHIRFSENYAVYRHWAKEYIPPSAGVKSPFLILPSSALGQYCGDLL